MTEGPTTELEWLESQGFAPPRRGWNPSPGADNLTTCPQCSATRKKSNDPCCNVRWDDRGVTTKCHHCGHGDGWIRPDARSREPSRRPARLQPERPEERERPRVSKTPNLMPTVLKWFQERGIGEETCAAFGVYGTTRWFHKPKAEKKAIAFPYRWNGEAVHHKYRLLSLTTKDHAQDRDTFRPMFGVDNLEGNDVAVWVEGEPDVMALYEAGIVNGITLCDGAKRPRSEDRTHDDWQVDPQAKLFQPYVNSLEKLAGIQKFVVWTDGDLPGRWLEHQIAERVGRDRCFVAQAPYGVKDANEALQKFGPDAVRAAIDNAKPVAMPGSRTFEPIGTIARARYGSGARKFNTGLQPFDDKLTFRKKQLVLVTGMPGDGKSNFVDYLLVSLTVRAEERGESWRTMMFSPEHQWHRHAGRMIEKRTGRLYQGFRREDIPASDDLVMKWEPWFWDHFGFIETEQRGKPMTPERLLEVARMNWMRDGLDVLVIDPYSFLDLGLTSNMPLTKAVQRFLTTLVDFAEEHEIMIFLIAHPAKLPRDREGKRPVVHPMDTSDSANFFNTCHVAFTVRRPHREKTDAEVHIWKVKEDDQGTPGRVDLAWDKHTGRYKPRETYDEDEAGATPAGDSDHTRDSDPDFDGGPLN